MKTTTLTKRGLAALLTLVPLGCNDSGDGGSGLTADASASSAKEATLSCKDGQGDLGEVNHAFRGVTGDAFTLHADWCYSAQSVGKVRILFVIDHSGSMDLNDPINGSSCGRLDAAKALVADLKAKAQAGRDEVEIASVSFHTDAQVQSNFVKLADFEALLTTDNFCKAEGGTSYVAAFEKAGTVLDSAGAPAAGATATPIMTYFVTDGQPSDEQSAAIQAATTFRTKLTGISPASALYAVFLGAAPLPLDQQPTAPTTPTPTPPSGTTPGSSGGFDDSNTAALKTLADVTGDATRVKEAKSAVDLAAKLAEFKLPVAGLDAASVQVNLKVADGAVKTLPCAAQMDGGHTCAVVQDPSDPGKWKIDLTFKLAGNEGRATRNEAEIVGKRTDGSAIRAKANVDFTSLR